ncbi:Glutathione S-transferase, domain-containing protein [Cladophialophora immunda]|nr:Glutathione S-transferase, domain-containing protein [Cladophialophora immunda]
MGSINLQQPPPPYDLYHNPFSICALQVRLCILFGKLAGLEVPGIEFVEHEIDIYNSDQLQEFYLRQVNPRGQVPALVNKAVLPKPIADSMEITYYLFELYPSLCPPQHAATIRELIQELHGISFLALAFFKPRHQAWIKNITSYTDERLARADISVEYRNALEWKRNYDTSQQQPQVDDESCRQANEDSRKYLEKVEAIRVQQATEGSPWLLGGEHPTALDAHVAVFVARLQETEHEDLVPEGMNRWAKPIMALPEWETLLKGKPTHYGVYNRTF